MLTLLKPETPVGSSDIYDTIRPTVKQFQGNLPEQQIVILLQERNQQGVSALYEKYAFKCVGRRKNYYPDNKEDAHIMTVEQINSESYRHFLDKQWARVSKRLAESFKT